MTDLSSNIKDERNQLKALEDLFNQKKFSDAFVAAKRLKETYPRSFQIRFFYVKVLKELNRLGEAEDTLKELMMVFPNNILLHIEMGKLAVERNKFDDAIDHYNKILFLDPFNSEAKAAIDKINLIKKNESKGEKRNTAFLTYSEENIHRADTLPEMDDFPLPTEFPEENVGNNKVQTNRTILKTVEPLTPKNPELDEKQPVVLRFEDPFEDMGGNKPPANDLKNLAREDTQKENFTDSFDDFLFTEQKLLETHDTQEIIDEPEDHNIYDIPENNEFQAIQEIQEVEQSVVNFEDIEETKDEEERQAFPDLEDHRFENESSEERPEFHIDLDSSDAFPQEEEEFPEIQNPLEETSEPMLQPSDPMFDTTPEMAPDITLQPDLVAQNIQSFEPLSGNDLEDIPLEPLEPLGASDEMDSDDNAVDDIKKRINENPEFVTESAAELYMNQELIEEALVIYNKLYDFRKEERFLVKINQLKNLQVNRKKIQLLNKFLKAINRKYKGDNLV